jgi:hypothetical protein
VCSGPLPGKPAGVEKKREISLAPGILARELLHLPGKPAGVAPQRSLPSIRDGQTFSLQGSSPLLAAKRA